jgi:hypothetical protein
MDGLAVRSRLHLGQRGGYAVSLSADASAIHLETTQAPVAASEIWGPLVTLVAVLIALFGLQRAMALRSNGAAAKAAADQLAAAGYLVLEPKDEEALAAPNAATPPAQPLKTTGGSARLNSLDTFRGLSLSLMIFVNYGGVGTGGSTTARGTASLSPTCFFPGSCGCKV